MKIVNEKPEKILFVKTPDCKDCDYYDKYKLECTLKRCKYPAKR